MPENDDPEDASAPPPAEGSAAVPAAPLGEQELFIAREQLAPVQRRLTAGFWVLLVLASLMLGLTIALGSEREIGVVALAAGILVMAVFAVYLGGQALWAVLLRRVPSAPSWLFATLYALLSSAALVFTVLFASGGSVFRGAFFGGVWALMMMTLAYGMHSQPYQLARRDDPRFAIVRDAIRAQGRDYSVLSWKARWILLDSAAEIVFGMSLGVLTAVQPLLGLLGIVAWALAAFAGSLASRAERPWLTVAFSWVAALLAAVPALGAFWGTVELMAAEIPGS